MNAAGVRELLLARAIEEGDREGGIVPPSDRRRLGREARATTDGDEAFLLRRSRFLLTELEPREPALARAARAARVLAPAPWVVVLVAFVLGALVDRVGGGRRIHLLVSPVLGLLAWNLAVYAFLAWGAWRRRRAASADDPAPGEGRLPLLLGLCRRLRERLVRAPGGTLAGTTGGQAVASLRASILARFLGDWLRASLPLQLARLRLALHLGALAFALGVLASLYLRGLVLDYHATWESTFLGPDQVHGLLAVVLFPATFVAGVELPGPEHLAALRVEPEGAARWIHLWALDTALVVVLPRALLAAFQARRARALEAALPLAWARDPYVLRLLAPERGAGRTAEVRPYSYRPSARARDLLAGLLLELLGSRARVVWRDPVAYGQGLDDLAGADEGAGAPICRVLLFNLAQSPEEEVHGRLAEAQRRALEGAPEGAGSLLVCVDEEPYVERMGRDAEAEQRVEERRRCWRRVLREAGLRAVFLRLGGVDGDQDLAAARGGLFPERALGAAG